MSATNQTYSLTYDLPIDVTKADFELLSRIFDSCTVNGECWEAAGHRNKVSGYVHLTISNAYNIRYVHRFVCFLFHNLPLNYRTHQCHHICGNKVCCRPSHLEPVSVTDHKKITHAAGQHPCGDAASWSILTESQVVAYRKRYADGETCPDLAKKAGVGRTAMWNALHGKSFERVPGAVEPNKRRDWRGEKHASARLKEVDIVPIYTAYWIGGKTKAELAKQYGVNHETIRAVVHNRTWNSVERPTITKEAA